MDIYLYDKNKQEILKFPVIPQSIEVSSPQSVENFNTIGKGTLKLIGLRGNRNLQLTSFFPVKEYTFLHDRTYKGMQYVNLIEQQREKREPFYIVISDLQVAFLCVIPDFTYSIQDGTGDIYYTLSIEEYKKPLIQETEIVSTGRNVRTILTTAPKEKPSPLQNSYGIAKKDTIVRDTKNLRGNVLGTLKEGERVKLFRLEGDYWHVYFGTSGGFVKATDIKRV